MSLNMTWTIVVCNACVGDEINWMAWGGGKTRWRSQYVCVCSHFMCEREAWRWPALLPWRCPLCTESVWWQRNLVSCHHIDFSTDPAGYLGSKSLPCEANEEETSEPYHPPVSHSLLFVFINSASFLTMTTLPISTHWSSSAEIMKWIIDEADRALTHSWNY